MAREKQSQNPLVKSASKQVNVWEDPAWQKAWLGTQRREWQTLAVIPSCRGISTVQVAQSLMDVGWQHRGEPMTVADFRDVQLAYLESSMAIVRAHVARGERVIVALRSIAENAAAAHVAQLLDCALLCVPLGLAEAQGCKRTVEEIGKERFIGSLVVRRTP